MPTPLASEALALVDPSDTRSVAGVPADGRPAFSARIMDFGFVAGVALAALCLLLSAYYLQQFLTATNEGVGELLRQQPRTVVEQDLVTMGISARLVMARLALRSCGVFVGLSFGFLGFSLFLIGVRGVMDAHAEHGDSKLTLVKLSPGVFVIFCSTVLIALCVTMSTPFEYTNTTSPVNGANVSKPDSATLPDPKALANDTQH